MANTLETESDEMIVSRITSGDIDSYAEIMTRYEAKLHRYVTYLIHDQAMATDVVQDTFIKAYQNLHGFKPKYKFSSWIYRIAHNEAMNAIKKTKHFDSTDIETLPDLGYNSHIDEIVDTDILNEHVHDCLAKLQPKYREVVQLVYLEHMKYKDVSDILHIPNSTVGVWLMRAKVLLKEICEQKGVMR